ncbi:MAG: S9 family peptidase [Bacteroidales bacterium]|nr:S9 family peptidase [Bacteroidales bacterium]
MRRLTFLFLGIMTLFSLNAQQLHYPETRMSDQKDIYFGHEIADPYRWLEDDNSPETAAWVEAQNALSSSYLSKIPYREALRQRLEKIWNYPKMGIPFKKGGRYFFYKNDGLQNQSVLYVQNSLGEDARILLDPNTFSADGTVALADISPSPNGKYLAYTISRGGSDWNEIAVMNLETGQMLPDTIVWVKFSGISWYKNGFYYSCYDAPAKGQALSGSNEYHKVKYHELGTPQENDLLVYQDSEHPLRNFSAYVTDDEAFMLLSETESTSGNSLFVKDLNQMNSDFVQIAPGFAFDYDVVDNVNGKLLMVTTDGAPMKQVVWVDPRHPEKENWKVVIPETEHVLESVSLAGDYIVAKYLEDANNKVYFFDLDGKKIRQLELPALGTVAGFSGDKNDPMAFYAFTSFTFPSTIYQLDVNTGVSILFAQSNVDFDPKSYVTKQVFFSSKDGTKVPMFIVHKIGLNMDGNNPLLLYGYGGFDISVTPSFSVARLPFLEQGGIYVSVNLRGGGEYGKAWHKAGQQMNKQNVFDDFIEAAEYLISKKYTNPQKLAIMGGSNGGLLVGAVMTQRPELFKVAIPIVGVLDMLRYQYFTIGWAWAADYGRSDDNEEMFKYLLAYSPLHNVKKGVQYPATLAITADHDDRVVPAHTFKFISELQRNQKGSNPILVRVETQAGHGAGKPTSKAIEENTDVYSFIMYNLGMKPAF